MSNQFPNRTGQAGIYQDDTTDYVELSGSAVAKHITFDSAATLYGIEDGDYLGISIEKDASNFKVWTASWTSGSPSRLTLVTEEESEGSISDSDAVTVKATITTNMLLRAITTPPIAQTVSVTSSRSLATSDQGKLVRCSSSSAIAITLPDSAGGSALPAGFHCTVSRDGSGTVTLDCAGSDTINGIVAGTGYKIPEQWQMVYVVQASAGAYAVYGGSLT